jgi:outer membrane biosynthesis protein TonB
VELNQPAPPLERRRVVVQRQQLKRFENRTHRDDSRLTMKSQLIAIVAAVLLVGCGESQQSAPAPESKPVEPVAEVPAQPSPPPAAVEPPEPIAEAAKPTNPPKAVSANKGADPARRINPKPPTAKAPEISIHDAARTGSIEAVKQHLADGAEVNAKSSGGRTPLHWAANRGHEEVAKLLIAKGAEVNAMDVLLGWTPLDYAEGETADLLRKHGGKTAEELKAEGK